MICDLQEQYRTCIKRRVCSMLCEDFWDAASAPEKASNKATGWGFTLSQTVVEPEKGNNARLLPVENQAMLGCMLTCGRVTRAKPWSTSS